MSSHKEIQDLAVVLAKSFGHSHHKKVYLRDDFGNILSQWHDGESVRCFTNKVLSDKELAMLPAVRYDKDSHGSTLEEQSIAKKLNVLTFFALAERVIHLQQIESARESLRRSEEIMISIDKTLERSYEVDRGPVAFLKSQGVIS